MPTTEAQGPTAEPKDSPDFLVFLEAEKAHPPKQEKANAVWKEFIATLDRLVGHIKKQERFLSLNIGELKPTPTDRAGSAAGLPS